MVQQTKSVTPVSIKIKFPTITDYFNIRCLQKRNKNTFARFLHTWWIETKDQLTAIQLSSWPIGGGVITPIKRDFRYTTSLRTILNFLMEKNSISIVQLTINFVSNLFRQLKIHDSLDLRVGKGWWNDLWTEPKLLNGLTSSAPRWHQRQHQEQLTKDAVTWGIFIQVFSQFHWNQTLDWCIYGFSLTQMGITKTFHSLKVESWAEMFPCVLQFFPIYSYYRIKQL